MSAAVIAGVLSVLVGLLLAGQIGRPEQHVEAKEQNRVPDIRNKNDRWLNLSAVALSLIVISAEIIFLRGVRTKALGHVGATHSRARVSWSDDGSRLFSPGDRSVDIWDPESGKKIQTLMWGTMSVSDIHLSPSNELLAVEFVSGSAHIQVVVFAYTPHGWSTILVLHDRNSPQWSPNGKWLSVQLEGAIEIYDAQTGEGPLWRLEAPRVDSHRWSPDSQRIASELHIWDIRGERPAVDLEVVFSTWNCLPEWSPEGARILLVCSDALYLWNATTGVLLETVVVDNFDSWAVSPNAKRLAVTGTAGRTTEITIYDTSTLERHGTMWMDGGRQVTTMDWSPKGYLATTDLDFDNLANIWDISSGNVTQWTFNGNFEAAVSGIRQIHTGAFSPDGLTLALKPGGWIYLWQPDLDSERRSDNSSR
jgi:WD40 repeat protein